MDRSRFRINRDLLVYKAFYFVFLGGFGSLFPYLPVYFRQIGLPASHVGLLIGFRPIVQFASAPFWAIVAERYRQRKAILVMSALAWLVMTLSLAFVEPTNEICEVRTGNSTKTHIMNYTKVKTGFFKRSIATLPSAVDRQIESEIRVSPDLVVVPLHRSELQLRMKPRENYTDLETIHIGPRLREHKTMITNSSLLSENSVSGAQINKQVLSSNSMLHAMKTERSASLKNNETITAGFSSWSGKEENLKEENPTFPLSGDSNNRSLSLAAKFDNSTHLSFHSGLPGTTNNSTGQHYTSTRALHGSHLADITENPGKDKRNATRLNTIKNDNQKRGAEEGISAGGVPAALESAQNITDVNDFKKGSQTRHKTRSQPSVIEFSKAEVLPPKLQSHIELQDEQDEMSGSELNDLESSGQKQLRWHPKGSESNTLKVRITGHISGVLQEASNNSVKISKSAEGLFHHTITMATKGGAASTKTSNIHHLSNVIKGISTNLKNASDRTTSKSITHRLTAFMIQKTNLQTNDKLHKEKVENSNTNVIHHNVLDHHVLGVPGELDGVRLAGTSGEDAPQDMRNEVEQPVGLPRKDALQVVDLSSSGRQLVGEETSGSGSAGSLGKYSDQQVDVSSGVLADGEDKGNDLERESLHIATPSQREETSLVTKPGEPGSNLENIEIHSENMSSLLAALHIGTAEFEKPKGELKIYMRNLSKSDPLELKRIFVVLLVLIVFGEFLESPCFTLADASLLEILGEERRFYGKQRLWGSIGFGLFSFIAGVLLERSQHVICGDKYTDYMICFCFFAVLMLLTLFVSAGFEFHYSDVTPKGNSVLSALCNAHYGSCLFAACIMGIDYGMCHNFLIWYLEDLGASKTLMGLAIISRCFSDTLTFYVAGSIIKACGQIRIMVAVLFSYSIIFTCYTLLVNPWWIIPIEVLDGVTYALAWSSCTSYLAGASSPESVTTIQGILQGVYWGLGTGSGAIVGGYLIHHVGPITTFRLTAGCSLLVCALFCLAQWKWTHASIPVDLPQTKYTYLPAVQTKDTEALLSGYDTYAPKTKRNINRIGSQGKFNNQCSREL